MYPGVVLTPQLPIRRRSVLRAGAAGILGVSGLDVAAWRSQAAASGATAPRPRSVIFLFSCLHPGFLGCL